MGWKIDFIKSIVNVQERLHNTDFIAIPGITIGAAHSDGDALGTMFVFENLPKAGRIQTGIFLDLDDEGIEMDLILFNRPFTPTADDAAFAVSDSDLLKLVGHITFSTFLNYANNQSSTASGLFLTYTAPQGRLYAQMVTRGTPNIAATNIPRIGMTIEALGLWRGDK